MTEGDKHLHIGGHKVRYLDSGSGPPIVMLHGLGDTASADQWRGAISYLEGSYRTLALDMVGWGLSDRPTDGYDFPLLVSTLIGFLEELELTDTTLIGHTLGGWTSALVAHARPDLVDRLILVNTAGLNAVAPRAPGPVHLPTRDELRANLEWTYGGSTAVSEAMIDEELARKKQPGALEAYEAVLRFINDPETRHAWSLRARLVEISCPTLVIWGADDDIIGAEHGREAVELLPHGELVLIEAGAHAPMARKPAEFAAAVQRFLAATTTPGIVST